MATVALRFIIACPLLGLALRFDLRGKQPVIRLYQTMLFHIIDFFMHALR